MKKIFFLHGNPGNPSDWDILISLLPKSIEAHKVDSYSDDWVSQVEASPEKVLIVAHSWGCYRALSKIGKIAKKVDRVFLINPYLEQEKPLSPIARVLLATPVLGSSLTKSNHRSSFAAFFEAMIAPQKKSDHPYYAKIYDRLAQPDSWDKALLGKRIQQEHPLKGRSSVLGYAYFGAADKTMNADLQRRALNQYQYIQPRLVEGAGHGLLWSHPEVVANDIRQMVEKTGYIKGETTDNNVINFLEKHVREHKNKIALRWALTDSLKSWDANPHHSLKHGEITFEQLHDKIARFAQGLLNIGIAKGDRVIIFLPMSVDMYVAMFAVQRIGAIAVFLDSWARSHHLGASADCVNPKAMISFDMAFKLVDQVPEFNSMPIRICYGPGEKFTHKYQDVFADKHSPIAPVESEFTALITFTTGSTGKPKGANRTHRFLVAQHFALTHVIPYTQADVDMPAFPIFSLNSLATGVTTVLPAVNLAQPAPTDSAILACQIINEKVTCTTLSPSMLVGLAAFCKQNKIVLSGLRRVVTGGAPISKDDVKAFYEIAPQTELWILYGSTEAEPMAHIEGREMLKDDLVGDLVESGVNVGEISEDIDYKLIRIQNGPIDKGAADLSDLAVKPGEVGEFVCTGDHVCREYYNNTDAFKTTKIRGADGRVWHRTGDLAYTDAHHNLWIVGRVNNTIERKGAFYFPVQAEVLLKRLEFTGRCAFLGMPAKDGEGQETCAVIELKGGINSAGFDFTAARREIETQFAKNNIPVDQIKFVKSVPMDPRHHSKVEYAVLRKILLEEPEAVIA